MPYPATRCKPICSSVKYVGPVLKPIRRVLKPFVQDYKTFRSTVLEVCSVTVSMLHSSLYQPVVTYVPYVIPFRIPTATFPSHIPNIWYTNASIWSVSFKPKTTSTLMYSLSFHQINASPRTFRTPLLTSSYYEKYVPTFATKPPYSPDQKNASSYLLQCFLLHHVRLVTELLQFLVPFSFPILWIVLLIL